MLVLRLIEDVHTAYVTTERPPYVVMLMSLCRCLAIVKPGSH